MYYMFIGTKIPKSTPSVMTSVECKKWLIILLIRMIDQLLLWITLRTVLVDRYLGFLK